MCSALRVQAVGEEVQLVRHVRQLHERCGEQHRHCSVPAVGPKKPGRAELVCRERVVVRREEGMCSFAPVDARSRRPRRQDGEHCRRGGDPGDVVEIVSDLVVRQVVEELEKCQQQADWDPTEQHRQRHAAADAAADGRLWLRAATAARRAAAPPASEHHSPADPRRRRQSAPEQKHLPELLRNHHHSARVAAVKLHNAGNHGRCHPGRPPCDGAAAEWQAPVAQ